MNWQPIATVPRDGSIVALRSEKLSPILMQWSAKNKRWEGKRFGILGVTHTYWDTEASEQPIEWVNPSEFSIPA